MWPYDCGHFHLRTRFRPMGWLGSSLIRCGIVNKTSLNNTPLHRGVEDFASLMSLLCKATLYRLGGTLAQVLFIPQQWNVWFPRTHCAVELAYLGFL